MNKIDAAREIVEEGGIAALPYEAASFFEQKVTARYYSLVGRRKLTLEDYEAVFNCPDRDAINKIGWMFDQEKELLYRFLQEIEPDDIVWDIGANIGIYTCFALNVVESGHVVAVEPAQFNVEQLEKNAAFNGDSYDVFQLALSDSAESVGVHEPSQEPGEQSWAIVPEESGGPETMRGDTIINDAPHLSPNIMKIDVEGAEANVVDGFGDILGEEDLRTVFCEVHLPREDDARPSIQDFGSSLTKLKDTFRELGFNRIEVLESREYGLQLEIKRNSRR